MMTGGGDEMGWNDEIHESPNTNSLSTDQFHHGPKDIEKEKRIKLIKHIYI